MPRLSKVHAGVEDLTAVRLLQWRHCINHRSPGVSVITQFVAWMEQLSGHAAVVAAVGAGFLAVQLMLCLRVLLRAALQRRALELWTRELKRGGRGRGEAAEAPQDFSWLRWVLAEFPAGAADSAAREARFTRDEALHELDVRIASDSAYLLLQRMSIMAPLVGVVLTVVGFYWLDVNDAGEQSLQTILTAVTPLVSGVGAGAVLALINQLLLHLAGGRLERLRMAARSWFDGAIWRHVGDRAGAAARGALVDHEKVARSFAATAAQLERTASAFQADMIGIPQALRGAREALDASAQMLTDLLPAATRSVANLDVSVAAFRTTVDREFIEAARLHHRASKMLANAVGDLVGAANALEAGRQDTGHATAGVAPRSANGEDAASCSVRPR